jgi:hypothetical protein
VQATSIAVEGTDICNAIVFKRNPVNAALKAEAAKKVVIARTHYITISSLFMNCRRGSMVSQWLPGLHLILRSVFTKDGEEQSRQSSCCLGRNSWYT